MPTFLIPQKVLGQDVKTTIKTMDGTPYCYIVGKWGLAGNVLSIYSLSGDLLASVKKYPNVFGTLGTRYDLYENFKKVGTMHRVFQLYFDLYYITDLKWQVIGNVFQHRYKIRTFSETILEMEVSRTYKGEYYIISIPKEENVPVALCVASVLDYWSTTSFKEKLKKMKYAPNVLPET